MKKQLFIKAFRAILVLVVFAGAVTMSNAQALPSRQDAALMLDAKLEQLRAATPGSLSNTPAQLGQYQATDLIRYKFYKTTALKIKSGLAVDAAIDAVYTLVAGRDQVSANTLRQEVIDYLTKS